MNHFFALELSPEARQTTAEIAARWRADWPMKTAWYAPDDYHITLKFLGDVPEERLPELIAAAKPIRPLGSGLHVALRHIGAFPNQQRPSVLWAGVHAFPAHVRLAERLDAAMGTLGFPCESRPYQPHITLARVRERGDANAGTWPDIGERPFAIHHVGRFVLMQTLPPAQRQKEAPGRYTIVQTFPFGNSSSSAQFEPKEKHSGSKQRLG